MILETVFVLSLVWDTPQDTSMREYWSGGKSFSECMNELNIQYKRYPVSPDLRKTEYPLKSAKCEIVKGWEGQTIKYDKYLTIHFP